MSDFHQCLQHAIYWVLQIIFWHFNFSHAKGNWLLVQLFVFPEWLKKSSFHGFLWCFIPQIRLVGKADLHWITIENIFKMIYGKGFHIMTAFGKAENCFVDFVTLRCLQGLGMNSMSWAPLLLTSNPLHKKCPKTYFLHCSCLPVRISVVQKTNLQGNSVIHSEVYHI